jgi:hypothetical protein
MVSDYGVSLREEFDELVMLESHFNGNILMRIFKIVQSLNPDYISDSRRHCNNYLKSHRCHISLNRVSVRVTIHDRTGQSLGSISGAILTYPAKNVSPAP